MKGPKLYLPLRPGFWPSWRWRRFFPQGGALDPGQPSETECRALGCSVGRGKTKMVLWAWGCQQLLCHLTGENQSDMESSRTGSMLKRSGRRSQVLQRCLVLGSKTGFTQRLSVLWAHNSLQFDLGLCHLELKDSRLDSKGRPQDSHQEISQGRMDQKDLDDQWLGNHTVVYLEMIVPETKTPAWFGA